MLTSVELAGHDGVTRQSKFEFYKKDFYLLFCTFYECHNIWGVHMFTYLFLVMFYYQRKSYVCRKSAHFFNKCNAHLHSFWFQKSNFHLFHFNIWATFGQVSEKLLHYKNVQISHI